MSELFTVLGIVVSGYIVLLLVFPFLGLALDKSITMYKRYFKWVTGQEINDE